MAKTNSGNKGKEIFEDPNALLEKIKDSEEFFKKNQKVITYVGGGLLLAIAAFLFYIYQSNQSNEAAQASMYNSVFAWEKDSTKRALNGDKTDMGLVDVIDEYSNTDAGNLANYYAGVAYLKEGKFEEAIDALKEFSSNDLLLQGCVYALIGDAYMEQKDFDNAVDYYKKAADYKSNESFTPKYLMKAALAYEVQKDYGSAVEAYEKIIKEYPTSPQATDAKKYKAKAEGLSAEK